MEVEDQVKEVEHLNNFFSKLNKHLEEIYINKAKEDLSTSSAQLSSDAIEFKIDSLRWIVSVNPISTPNEFVKKIVDEISSSIPTQCQIICTDVSTFLNIVYGKINPLRALISGKLKINGDRKLFTRLSEVFKTLRFKLLENENENTSSSSRDQLHLQVQLVGMETKLRTNHNQKPLILYKLSVSGRLGNSENGSLVSWTITRRFNEFKELRRKLCDQQLSISSSSYKSYPSISYTMDNFTLWTELAVLRQERLQIFLQDILSRPELMQNGDSKTLIEEFFDVNSHLQDRINISFEVEDTRWKDISSPIRCQPGSFETVNVFLREMHSIKTRLLAEKNGKQLSLQIFPIIVNFFGNLINFCVGIAVSFIVSNGYNCAYNQGYSELRFDYIPLFPELNAVKLGVPTVRISWVSTSAAALLMSMIINPTTRFPSIYAVLVVAVINIQKLEISRLVPLLFIMIWSTIKSLPTVITQLTENVLTAAVFLPRMNIVFILFISLLSIYVSAKFHRLIHVYALGSSLISLYMSLKVICKILRLSDESQTILYNSIDSIVAPLVVLQIKKLKSLFIKFAQYFGGRSDMITPVWCEALSLLQDSCEASSPEHVRRSICEAFHASVEDLFESFEWTPVASASIGQVHLATLKNQETATLIRRNSDTTSTSSSQYQETTASEQLSCKTDVVVKVQHQNIAALMESDVEAVLVMIKFVSRFDERWHLFVQVLESWKRTMHDELNFIQEATNLVDVADGLSKGRIPVMMPQPIRGLCSSRVMVMTRLHGFKVTEKVALRACKIDKHALVNRIAHSLGYQLLVMGIFNGDPHAGNLFVCPTSVESECSPGLLDFGMTVRISRKQRLAYCKLFLGLAEGDIDAVNKALSEIGYGTNQRSRAPERDAEFFLYLFRNAASRDQSKEESKEFMAHREDQRKDDVDAGVREKGGRRVQDLPEEFLFLTRVVGLMRGLTAELDVDCPILQILAYHAERGLK